MPTDPVEKALYRQFRKIKSSATLGQLSRILERDQFVVVVELRRVDTSQDAMEFRDFIVGIVTPIDLLTYITNPENAEKIMKHQNGSMHRSNCE